MSPPVLLDSTVLSNFAAVNRADLPARLWQDATCTTAAVLAEYAAGVVSRSLPSDAWSGLPIVAPTGEEIETAATLPSTLRPGERTCLAPIPVS